MRRNKMKRLLVLLMSCVFFCACTDNHGAKTKGGKTFVKFANAKTIKEKSKYILNPEEMVPYMEDYYKGKQDLRLPNYEIIQEIDKGDYVVIKTKIIDRIYWTSAKKEDGTYKIDWQDFTRYTPQTLGEFIVNDDKNKKFKVYAIVDRSVPPLFTQIIKDYYVLRIVPANLGQGVINEKEDGYTVNEAVLGLCPKKQNDCKEFYNALAKTEVNGGCYATLQLENAPADFANPLWKFALTTQVVPHWRC